MGVEVTLQRSPHTTIKPNKSCWFPFKKQVESRRKITEGADCDYDYGGIEWGTGGGPNSKKHTRVKNYSHNQNQTRAGQSKTGSVSTGTDASSYGGYSNDSSPNSGETSSLQTQQSYFSQHTRNLSHLSHQTDNSLIENAFLMSSNDSVVRMASLDEEDSILELEPVGVAPEYQQDRMEKMFPMQLSLLETNCAAREFWTDEVVDGGTFSCLQQRTTTLRSTACFTSHVDNDNGVEVEMGPEGTRGVTFNMARNSNDFKIVQEVNYERPRPPNRLDQRIQKSLQAVVNKDRSVSHAKGVRYVAQEPEDINQGSPLRRALCTNVRLRKNNQSSKQQRQKYPTSASSQLSSLSSSYPSSQHQTETSASSSVESSFLSGATSTKNNAFWHEAEVLPPLSSTEQSTPAWQQSELLPTQGAAAVDCLDKPCANYTPSVRNRRKPVDEQTPNFYVEVEAMREQLNRIRDLDELRAEGKRLEKDIGMARTSSLVDVDSTFMESVFEDDESDILSEAQKQIVLENNRRASKTKAGNRGMLVLCGRKSHNRVSEGVSRNAELKGNDLGNKNQKVLPNSEKRNERTAQLCSTLDRSKKIDSGEDSKGLSSRDLAFNDMSDRSTSKGVVERIQKREQKKSSPETMEPTMDTISAKYYQRREALGLTGQGSPESSPSLSQSPVTSSSSSPSVPSPSSSSSSYKRESPGLSSTSFDSFEVNSKTGRRKIKPPPPRSVDRHVAKDTYFGLQQQSKEERPFSTSALPAYNSYGNENSQPAMTRLPPTDRDKMISPIPNFDDEFWKDDEASEIKTAAFEEYDADDSLFGDLKSAAESNVSKESEPSPIHFANFEEHLTFDTSNNFHNNYSQEVYESTHSRADTSWYTNRDQSEYTAADLSRANTADQSRYTGTDDSRYNADESRYTAGEYSQGGETSFVSRTSRGTKTAVSAYLDEEDGEFVAYIDKWLY